MSDVMTNLSSSLRQITRGESTLRKFMMMMIASWGTEGKEENINTPVIFWNMDQQH